MASVTEISSEENSDFSVVYGALFGVGICYRCLSGVEVGHAVVGLQWTFSESERTYLSALCGGLWVGWNAVKLSFNVLLYALVSQAFCKVAQDTVCNFTGLFCSGFNLVSGKSQYWGKYHDYDFS